MTVTNVEAWLDDNGRLHRTKEEAESHNKMMLRDKLINQVFPMSDKLYEDIGWRLRNNGQLRVKVYELMRLLESEGLI